MLPEIGSGVARENQRPSPSWASPTTVGGATRPIPSPSGESQQYVVLPCSDWFRFVLLGIGDGRGYFALVLHAHLPFVRHPEDPTVMEEQWLYEAITGTYLPLLQMFEGLVADGVPVPRAPCRCRRR